MMIYSPVYSSMPGCFLFCHGKILPGMAFSVKVYVFMERSSVEPVRNTPWRQSVLAGMGRVVNSAFHGLDLT